MPLLGSAIMFCFFALHALQILVRVSSASFYFVAHLALSYLRSNVILVDGKTPRPELPQEGHHSRVWTARSDARV